jgi:hypothetical protein
MRMNFGEVLNVQALDNHSVATVVELGILLAGSIDVTPDPKRKHFYEIEDGRTVYYVYVSPWAQEASGSNPDAPTIYFFVFNLLCSTWSASEPELGSIWVQIRASRHFPRRDAALPGSRANKSRA